MLVPFAKLKDTTLLVSNILRDFNPETMFWREDSPILFPNYGKEGFTPYKPVFVNDDQLYLSSNV